VTPGRGRLALLSALVLVAAAGREVFAQTSLAVPLQFDFINPGAKSLATGGAFVGLADDATATFTNPAGLILISRSEGSLEARRTNTETPFLERGRLSGVIFNDGTDTIQGPSFGTIADTHGGLALTSFVYVPRPASRWRVAGFRHELARLDQRFLSNGPFFKLPDEFTSRRDSPQEGIRQVSITGYGATAAVRLHQQISVGLGVTAYRFDIDSQFRRFDTDGFLGPPILTTELGRSTQQGEDTSLAPTVGVLVGLTGRVRGGAMYRHGPSFTFRTKDGNDPERSGQFRVPHTFAVGGSVRPLADTTMLVVAAEVTFVNYARLREDFVIDQALAVDRTESFFVRNGTEVHVGVQYLPTLNYLAPKLRFGVWRDPDHSVQFTPRASSVDLFERAFDERIGTALSQGRDLTHVSGGVGFSLSPRVEANAAIDVTSRTRVWSASVVLR
jgi:long-chain fatty acid transport protein